MRARRNFFLPHSGERLQLRVSRPQVSGRLDPSASCERGTHDADGDLRAPLPAGAVLVVGSERDGVGAALRARADAVLALPMRPGVSSLNLATAVAAALYRR